MAAMLSILMNLIGGQYVADALIMAVTVLACQQDPDTPAKMFGIEIPTVFLPFAQMLMSYMASNGQQFPWMDVFGMIVGYLHYSFNDNLKPDAEMYKKLKAKSQRKKPDNSKRRKPPCKKEPKLNTLADLPSTGG